MLANPSELVPAAVLNQSAADSVMNVSVSQQGIKKERTACQRFLERGNKPVPLNYEEQDVLPTSHDQSYADKIKMLYGTQNQLATKTKTKFNLGDFDEEINGVNLSKLFVAYGPSSILEKDRRHKTQAGPRVVGALGAGSPMNHVPRTAAGPALV